MQITIKDQNNTSTTLLVVADKQDLTGAHQKALTQAGKELKLAGFRKGKAPAKVVEKNVDQAVLTSEFLNIVVPELVGKALEDKKISTIIAPQVNVTKMVPFTVLELEIVAEYMGEIKLADYKKLSKKAPKVETSKEDVEAVTKRIQMDMALRTDVDRKAKKTDQVWIDFKGVNSAGKEVKGASGTDYPVAIGTNTFIPGFEDNLIGLSKGDKKEFTLTFPSDYGVKALADQKVTFSLEVKKIQSVDVPEINDELAAKVGPYKSVKELLTDIEKQVKADKLHKAQLNLESEIMKDLADKTEVEMPEGMIAEQIKRMVSDHAANLKYRGIEYEQWLEDQKLTAQEHSDSLKESAVDRLKGGIVLSEIAKAEGIEVSDAEVEAAMSQYRQQFAGDPKMMEQLKTSSARRDIMSRVLTDKALTRLKSIVVK